MIRLAIGPQVLTPAERYGLDLLVDLSRLLVAEQAECDLVQVAVAHPAVGVARQLPCSCFEKQAQEQKDLQSICTRVCFPLAEGLEGLDVLVECGPHRAVFLEGKRDDVACGQGTKIEILVHLTILSHDSDRVDDQGLRFAHQFAQDGAPQRLHSKRLSLRTRRCKEEG